MTVLGVLSLTLEVPDIEAGVEFYSDAGLTSAEVSHTAAPVPAAVTMSHGLKHG